MRAKDTATILLCLIVGVGFLLLASLRLDPIRDTREDMGLVANPSLENAPPSLAFATVAMGAFRGLIVDILWIRADNLKQEGKFFDAKQLAEWITVLQPRFAAVWDYHAWNMAYNISVAIPNTQPEQRWHWVKNGYELLRDRAIELNPHNIMLYRSLAWIFQHKMGGVSDDCHKYYKRELALSMRPLLGDKNSVYFEALAAAPETLKEISSDSEIETFLSLLKEADESFEENIISHYLSLRQKPDRFKKEAFDVIEQYRGSDILERFDLFAKAWELRNTWKMDIDMMGELNQRYGPVSVDDPNERQPLNWEHPATHAIYWASLGLKKAGRPDEYRIDEKNTDRIVFHGLQELYRRGRIVLYEKKDQLPEIYLLPDTRMFESCDAAWENVIEKYQSFEKGNPKAVKTGHKNFLENAVLSFYQAGRHQKAEQLYRRLQKEHLKDAAGFVRKEYTGSFMAFIRYRFKDELQSVSLKDAVEFIVNIFQESYFLYAIHNDDVAAGNENMAQEVYTVYQKEMGIDEPGRMGLPPLDFLRYQAFVSFLNNPVYPEQMRAGLWGRMKLERPDLFEKLQKQEIKFLEKLKSQQQQQQAP